MAVTQQAHNPEGTEFGDAAALLGSLDSLRVAVTVFSHDDRLIYANAHLNHLLPTLPPHTLLLGRHYRDIVALEIAGGEIAAAALAGGAPAFIATRLAQLRGDARVPLDVPLADHRVMEIKARRTPEGRTVLLWTDVSAARAQMARLQEAVALSAEAFAFFDKDDRLVLANALYAQLCNVSLGAMMGLPFPAIASLVAHSGRIRLDGTPEEWLERRLKGHRESAGAVTIETNTGECYLVRDRASPDGGRVMVFTDITDKVRAETALAEQQHALADANAKAEKQSSYLANLARRLDRASASVDSAKTTLLRTMGHELKTPLNAILGFSDLIGTLADKLTTDQIREYAGLVHQGGTNLLKMINQIMDLTKISAGRYDLRRAPIDAGDMLWRTREAFEARQARGIAINISACPGLVVDADETVFAAMMHSLADNAVTFARSKVLLSAMRGQDGIVIAVCDDGPGVAAEDLARILEPFEHAGRSDGSDHSKGAGLGLTLVKAFAELHGGRLDLQSGDGGGFCARLTLPAAPGTGTPAG